MTRQPATSIDPAIKAYYDRAPEESRLEVGASRLEELRSRELILRHSPEPPVVLLDVGGAAGPYAFWLAERGYDVRLFDAVPRLIEVARQRNEHAVRRLAACCVADARALPSRTSRPQWCCCSGRSIISYKRKIGRKRSLKSSACSLRAVCSSPPPSRDGRRQVDGLARELLSDREFARIVERDLLDGQHQNPTNRLDYFTTAYLHRPEDLRREVVNGGFDVEGLYGIEGPGWILPDFEERWNDQERREMVLQVARALESEPSVLGCSAHLMVIGRKPRRGRQK